MFHISSSLTLPEFPFHDRPHRPPARCYCGGYACWELWLVRLVPTDLPALRPFRPGLNPPHLLSSQLHITLRIAATTWSGAEERKRKHAGGVMKMQISSFHPLADVKILTGKHNKPCLALFFSFQASQILLHATCMIAAPLTTATSTKQIPTMGRSVSRRCSPHSEAHP